MTEKKESIFTREIGKKNVKIKYPEKTYINLVQSENKGNDRKAFAWFLVFLIVLAIFTKFAVLDQLDKISRAEAA